jgi:DNA-directed RNA polymerase specialized sigma24 family protein
MVTLELSAETLTAADREKLFSSIYENAFPAVARFIKSRNGSLQDAKDVFHDALVIFYEKLNNDFELNVSNEAYVIGISKHVWIRKFNRGVMNIPMDRVESLITIPDDYYEEVQSAKLMNFIAKAGKKCMEMLTAFYYHKFTMDAIVKVNGFGSVRSATVQKYKCLEKIRDIVKTKSIRYEDFTE